MPDGEREVRDTILARIAFTVAVGIVEDVSAVLGPPAVQRQLAHLHHLTVLDRDVDEVEVVVLRLVPPGERVVAVGHTGDVEGAVGLAARNPDRHVAGLQVHQRDPRPLDRAADLGAGVAAPEVERPAVGWRVGLDADDDTLDLARAGAVQRIAVAWVGCT